MPGAFEFARLEAEAENHNAEPEVGLPIPLPGPVVFGSLHIRITLIPPADEQVQGQKLLALEHAVDRDIVSALAGKMHRGTIELDITDAFGKQRTIRVSPAELVILLQMAEKFVQELPR